MLVSGQPGDALVLLVPLSWVLGGESSQPPAALNSCAVVKLRGTLDTRTVSLSLSQIALLNGRVGSGVLALRYRLSLSRGLRSFFSFLAVIFCPRIALASSFHSPPLLVLVYRPL